MEQDKKEVCMIRVLFPVNSDEEAIALKKKIKEALADKPDAQMQFSIMPLPPNAPTI